MPVVGPLGLLDEVFAEFPHVLYCVKNAAGQYTAANMAFVHRCGVKRVAQVIGKCAADLFPSDLAGSYEAQDRAVLSTGRRLVNHLETIARAETEPGWFLTTKVKDASGDEPRLVVVSIDLGAPVSQRSSLDHLSGMLTAVRSEPGRSWKVKQLADMVGVGERQLERRMQRVLGMSVKGFLQSERVAYAARLLTSSSYSLAEVAANCGYYDQSQFSRQFRAATGLTPGRYRRL
jgi:AraC-like DNA-binding protein